MRKKWLLTHLATLTTGLFIMAMGIALCIRADLGITPISCPPYVLSLGLAPTVGQFTMFMHLLFILGQRLLLPDEFRAVQWLQILLSIVFGMFIDLCMSLTSGIVPSDYPASILLLLAGNMLLPVGMCLEMKSGLILVPTDGFVQSVCRRTGYSFSVVKIAFDVSLLLISVVCSLALLGRIAGIREGTIISSILVGYLFGFMRRLTK